ncbi:efflux RND transporter permease subunit, partial [Klebsiella pneumoniae]|nr:efflux RND transporter permease subunit [Klebsiella pneumoniae]
MARLHAQFENKFTRLRSRYSESLSWALDNAKIFIPCFLAFVGVSILLLWPWLGSNFFPNVDAGQIKLHISAPTGT